MEVFGIRKNKANEIAKEIIRSAKSVFNEKITNISLFEVTDEPYSMFSIKFVAYEYFVVRCNYDRGHFGCNIVSGEDAISIQCKIEWDDHCDYKLFWNEINEQIRLRIPDKFLSANNWL